MGTRKLIFLFYFFCLLNFNYTTVKNLNIQNLKDPFNSMKPKLKSNETNNKNFEVSLIGVINSKDRSGAIIQFGLIKETVFINSKIGGYLVKEIGKNYIILTKDGKNFTLTMKKF